MHLTGSLSPYRPIFDLSFLSKIIENVILAQLLEHPQVTHILPTNQSVYRQLSFALSTLCFVVKDFAVLMDKGSGEP